MCNGNDSNSIGHLLAILYRYGNIYVDKKLVSFEIGAAQAKILLMLYKNESLTQIELAEVLRLNRGNITRSIKKLERIGYLKRVRDNKDNRIYHIKLTEEGRKIKPVICNIFSGWVNIILEDFSDKDRIKLFKYMDEMVSRAVNYLKKNNIDSTNNNLLS